MTEKTCATWLKEAQADIKAGNALIDIEIYHLAAFHFVQAAEKAIKAVLYLKDVRPWGHSIISLLEDYEKLGGSIEQDVKDAAIDLEPHYTDSRYPGDVDDVAPSESFDKDMVLAIRDSATRILDFVEQEINTWEAKKGDEEH
jgi:HEPN domain-containing protein